MKKSGSSKWNAEREHFPRAMADEGGVIDEYPLGECPVVLGSGTRLFPDGINSLRLNLLETKQYDRGLGFLRYRSSDQQEREWQRGTKKGNNMIRMIYRDKPADFAKWKSDFDSHSDAHESIKAIDAAPDVGINFLDTAEIFERSSLGKSGSQAGRH